MTAEVPGSRDRYVAVINLSDTERTVAVPWREVGLVAKPVRVMDLWRSRAIPVQDGLSATLKAHASLLVRVSR